MKYKNTFLIALASFVLSCSNENVSKKMTDPKIQSKIIGYWGINNSIKPDVLISKDSINFFMNFPFLKSSFKYHLKNDSMIIINNLDIISYKLNFINDSILIFSNRIKNIVTNRNTINIDTAYKISKPVF